MKNLPERRIRWMRMRLALLTLALVGGASAVTLRAWHVQVDRAEELRALAEDQQLRDVRLGPKRGSILDRHGAELAVSVDVDSVSVNPRQLRRADVDPAQAADLLAKLLNVDRETIEGRLRSERYFAWIKRHVSPREAAAVKQIDIPGVSLTTEAQRFYPNRQLAANLLGFVNIDGKGVEGLELAMDAQLRGTAGAVPALRDRRGMVVFSEQFFDASSARGDDVTLTLDRTIQHLAERELALAVQTFEAKGGSVVVLDPRTGELLAMASNPTFNPNDPGNAPNSHHRNRAVTDRFEPGSTIKPLTLATALERKAIDPNRRIDCEKGAMRVSDRTIHDTRRFEKLTPAEIIAHSSNIGTAKIGMALGPAGLYRGLRSFGLGQRSDVGLPGEAAGSLRSYKHWYEIDSATISFGQGLSVTTLQLTLAIGALANQGKLMQPILVKRVSDARGQNAEEAVPRVRRYVVSPRVARVVTDMMTGVTASGGTGVEAATEGYLVAGKTGTAQKADPSGGYAEDRWLSSFVGFAPADRPRLVVAVVVDEPMIAHYGGTVAGPVFRRIVGPALRHLGVPARLDAPEPEVAARRAPSEDEPAAEEQLVAKRPPAVAGPGGVVVPELMGLSARAALVRAHGVGVEVVMHGSGVVVAQQPPAGEITARGGVLHIELDKPSLDAPQPATAETPAWRDADSKQARATRKKAGRDG